MDLSEFLLARIAEREELARAVADAPLLAECEAKRRIVEIHRGGEHMCPSADALEDGLWSVTDQDVMRPCPTLYLLAVPYAAHPDYQPGWVVQAVSA